jgi:hypothetical protein
MAQDETEGTRERKTTSELPQDVIASELVGIWIKIHLNLNLVV